MKTTFLAVFLPLLLTGDTSVSAAWDDGEIGNGNDKGEGEGHGGGGKPKVPEECFSEYNEDICIKMEKIAEGIEQNGNIDMEEFHTMKQLMKEARPVNNDKMNFKEVTWNVLDRNRDNNGEKDKRELLLEIVDELESEDLKGSILTALDNGYSEVEEGVPIAPDAGELEDSVDPPPDGERRRLGVTLKGNGRDVWPSWTIPYIVVVERDWSGYWTWSKNILPAMNQLEDLTGLTFDLQGYVWTASDATERGVLYVKTDASGCWAQVGYYPNVVRKMNIGNGCESNGVILHELLHVAGMKHQQAACYRDNYVTVNYDNIRPGKSHNFDTVCNHGYEFIFDYGSIMQYGEYAFSIGSGLKTIDCRGRRCGQRTRLTTYDQFEIILFYWGYYNENGFL